MKKNLLGFSLIALLCAGKAAAQDAQSDNNENPSVEKSITGIQIGDGLMFTHEFKLADKITLRTDAGLTLAFFGVLRAGLMEEKIRYLLQQCLLLQ